MPTDHGLQDVIVIGGGPAGSTAASFLAMKGRRVTVLEKEKFPREHVGESLLPFCFDLLEELGVVDQLEQSFVRKPGVRFIDIDGKNATTWCFGHVLEGPKALSFHVIRAHFDDILLRNSARHGATVHEQTRVRDVDLDGDAVEIRATDPDGGEQTLRARFLIDASGRDTFMLRRRKWKVPHEELDRAALSTHWEGARFTEGLEEGLLQIVYLGGDKLGWIWVIPVTETRSSIGVVLNHAYIRDQKARLKARGIEDWQTALYRQELRSSGYVREVIDGAEIAQPLMFNGDYSYLATRKFGRNFSIVGDAATFIDPILASGVFLSMNSARLVAEAVDRKLEAPGEEGDAALAGAYDQIDGAYRLVDKAIRFFYNPSSINFAQAGSAAELIHNRHEHALAAGHYLLAGDFFENHRRYHDFIDLLQEPGMFTKYNDLVLEKRKFQGTSCGLEHSDIFGKIMAERVEEMLAMAPQPPAAAEPEPVR